MRRVVGVWRGLGVLRDTWLRIPKAWIADMGQLRDELTISNPAYWAALNSGVSTEDIEQKLILYREDKTYVEVPRHYAVRYNKFGREFLKEWGHPIRIRSSSFSGSFNITHNIVPRDKVQREATLALQKHSIDKILSLGCGSGKTPVSLHAAAELNLFPLLIIVNTNALMDQWTGEIQRFYQENGGPIKVGRIQQGQCDWEGFAVSVAMLHTITKKEYPKAFYRYWKLMIGDEVHRLGAQKFMAACGMFPAERWGLSATLHRSDGMDKVIQLHLGAVAYQNLEQPLKPQVYFAHTNISINERKFKNYRSGRINLPKVVNHLAEHVDRNEMISSWIRKCYDHGRTILVLGERVGQLKEFLDKCQCESKAMHVGQMSKEERREALTKQVVFATQHIAREGLDRPAFDTLFILYPFGGEGRLRQSIGRILRIKDGKKEPLVFIFVDNIGIMEALSKKMSRHLHKLEFKSHLTQGDRWVRGQKKAG